MSVKDIFGVPDDKHQVVSIVLKLLRRILKPDEALSTGSMDVSLTNVDGASLTDVLADVDAMVRGASVNPRHEDTMAHLVQPPATIAVVGDLIIGALNQCAFMAEQGPLVARVEREVLRWMAHRLGLAQGASGLLTSGGTASNMLALFLARHRLERTPFYNVAQLRVIASDQAHFSIDKASRLIGLADDAVIHVRTDIEGRLQAGDVLRTAERVITTGQVPFFFAATIGTAGAGIIEPIEEYLSVSQRFGAWLHLDAAHGGMLALLRDRRQDFEQWQAADSISWDPHKSLFVPFASGALFLREPTLLDALAFHSDYVLHERDSEDVGYRHPDGARRFEALKIWMVIKHLGLSGLMSFSEKKVKLAALFSEELRRSKQFEVMTNPDLNIVCFRFVDPDLLASETDTLNLAIKSALFKSRTLVLSTTRLGGRVALRAVFANPALSEQHLPQAVARIRRCGEGLLSRRSQKEFTNASIAGYKPAS